METATRGVDDEQQRSGAAAPARAWWLRWAGGSLVATGLVVGGMATRGEVRPSRAQLPAPLVIGAPLLALAAGGVLVAAALRWYARRQDEGLAGDRVEGTAAGGVEAGEGIARRKVGDGHRVEGRRDPGRSLALATLVLAAGLGAYVWRQVGVDVDGGLPTRALPLVAGALVLVALGALVLALVSPTPTRDPAARRARRLLAPGVMALAGLAGAATVVGVASVATDAPLSATTAPAAGPVLVEEAPSEVAWTWEAPGSTALGDDPIVAAGPGVAVRTADGVVALDGRTGEERWHHRRDGALADRVAASPSGDWVVVLLRSSSPDRAGARLVALDGGSGEVGLDRLTGSLGFGGGRLVLTDHVILGGDVDGGEYEAISLDEGRSLWRWEAPGGCVRNGTDREAAAADVVVVAMVCVDDAGGPGISGDVVVVALDDRSGDERWRHAVPFAVEPVDGVDGGSFASLPVRADVRASVDGTAVELTWTLGRDGDRSSVYLAGSDGDELYPPPGGVPHVDDFDAAGAAGPVGTPGSGPVTRARRPAAGPLQELPVTDCAGPSASTTVAAHLLEVCASDDPGPADGSDRPATVSVTPWAGDAAALTIDLDLGPPASGAAGSAPEIVALPSATVVHAPGGTRLVGLR